MGKRYRPSLVTRMQSELLILRAAWMIAGDDNRRRKQLTVSPQDVKRWTRLIRAARNTP